ncbi:serine/threonine-protein kinase [Chitinivorax sp. B]|uniref:serine/threonine-protein kinase n=1 Tax=Chitinivorax sp. B TaxID=2502235 RepID=UPI0010F91350|nr:serine/threonine-protein kinase [Chitinivorax sp. B]
MHYSLDTTTGTLLTGSLGGQYELRDKLGEGGFSEVYVAWDVQLHREVAVKLLKTSGPDETDKLLREARLAAQLHHAAFVKIFAVATLDGVPAIVMERVPGQTLRQVIEAGVLPAAAALTMIDQIAIAMTEAHAAGLVHGDIKPSNLMQEPSGTIRILDFGIARQIDPLQTQTSFTQVPLGTPAYMAPEQLLGQRANAGCDIFALGMVLYELICGHRPFAELNGFALASARIYTDSANWPLPNDLPAGLISLIRAMTAQDPATRLSTMAAVRQHIALVLQPGSHVELETPTVKTGRTLPHWLTHLLWATPLAIGIAIVIAVWPQHLSNQPTTALPAPPMTTADHLSMGEAAMNRFDRDGALDEAIGHFKAVLTNSPNHAAAAAWLALAYVLRYVGDGQDEVWLKQAAISAQLAMRSDDQLALAHVAHARVLSLQGQPDVALQVLGRALSLDPANQQALDAKANLLIEMERHTEAEATLEHAMQTYPKERVFLDILGTLRYRQANYAAAELAFRRSIALQPDAVYAYANLNAALVRQNRLDEALRILQQGLQIRPSGRLYSNLGTALFAKGDYLGAATAFEHAVSGNKGSPNNYLKWANLGDALRWVPGREGDSKKAYQRASQLIAPLLQRSPNEVTLISRAALYDARLGQAKQARQRIDKALANAPRNADVHFRAALAYELLGLRTTALQTLHQARALGYPDSLIEAEPDFIALRRDSAYQRMLTERTP